MSAYNIPGFELDQEVEGDGQAGTALKTTASWVDDLTQETRRLSRPAQIALYGATALLLLTVPVLLLIGLLGVPIPTGRGLALGGGAVLILGLMAIVYGLARQCEKKRAGESFGAQVDRRPRL